MYVGRRISGANINERTGPGAIEVHMSQSIFVVSLTKYCPTSTDVFDLCRWP